MSTQSELMNLLIEWDKFADQFRDQVQAAAQADNDYKRWYARTRIELRATGGKMTIPDLDAAIVDADTGELALKAEMAEGMVTAMRKKLDVFAARHEALRSQISSERQQQQAWASSPAVPTQADVPPQYRSWG